MNTSNLTLETFTSLSEAEYDERIRHAKAVLGKHLVILGHHYQRDSVFKHADFTGDSLKLARQAAQSGSNYLVFCGVHFMAEVAAILGNPKQRVILPDLTAGCSMADMADLESVERVWHELATLIEVEKEVIPVTYINSSANLKAFCGRHGGIVCTSSNARRVLQWAFQQRKRVLFFPDQHLGRNTAFQMGIPLTEMVVWNTRADRTKLLRAKMILWPGFCSVHQLFEAVDVDNFRATYPDAKVIVHPECAFEVCQKADAVGSTEFIIKIIKEAPAGTCWGVGTEWNLVNRLAQIFKNEGKKIHFLSPTICQCSTMFRIDPPHLLWVLENLIQGQIVNEITIVAAEAEAARLALTRMLSVSIPTTSSL